MYTTAVNATTKKVKFPLLCRSSHSIIRKRLALGVCRHPTFSAGELYIANQQTRISRKVANLAGQYSRPPQCRSIRDDRFNRRARLPTFLFPLRTRAVPSCSRLWGSPPYTMSQRRHARVQRETGERHLRATRGRVCFENKQRKEGKGNACGQAR